MAINNLAGINDYIAGFPKDVQAMLEELRLTIREAAPAAEETINYGIPTFTLKGNLVHFGAFANHMGFILRPPELKNLRRNYPYMREQKVR